MIFKDLHNSGLSIFRFRTEPLYQSITSSRYSVTTKRRDSSAKKLFFYFIFHQAVTCPTLSPPTNGELLGCNTTQMLYDTACRFSCNEGSKASGSTVRRCTENGNWTGPELICTGIINSLQIRLHARGHEN